MAQIDAGYLNGRGYLGWSDPSCQGARLPDETVHPYPPDGRSAIRRSRSARADPSTEAGGTACQLREPARALGSWPHEVAEQRPSTQAQVTGFNAHKYPIIQRVP